MKLPGRRSGGGLKRKNIDVVREDIKVVEDAMDRVGWRNVTRCGDA